MTVKATMTRIRSVGMSVRYSDGEYRVNYPNGAESTAYYTSDATDAIQTAIVMSRNKTYRTKTGRFGIFGA